MKTIIGLFFQLSVVSVLYISYFCLDISKGMFPLGSSMFVSIKRILNTLLNLISNTYSNTWVVSFRL